MSIERDKFRAYDTVKKEWLTDFRILPDGRVMKPRDAHDGKWEYSTDVLDNIKLYSIRLPSKQIQIKGIKETAKRYILGILFGFILGYLIFA